MDEASGPGEASRVELMRALRTAALLQHQWVTQTWRTRYDLHPAAGYLLGELAQRGESRPTELARDRMVDLSVISRQIAQLSAAGLVERRPAPEDGRAALVRVSERGTRELAQWRERIDEFLRVALRNWDDATVDELTDRLGALNGDLRAAVGGEAGCVTATPAAVATGK